MMYHTGTDDRHRQHADDQLETGSRYPQKHGEDGDIHQSGAEVGLQNHQNQRNEYVNAQRNQLAQRLNRLPALGKQVCQRDDDGDLTEFGRLQTALTQVTGAGAPLEEGGHTAAAGFHRKHGEQNEDVRPVDQVGVAAEKVVVEEDHRAHGDDTGQHPEKLKARVGDGVGVKRLRQPVHLFLRRPCGSGVDGNNAKQRYADYEQEQRPVKMPDQSGIEPVFLNVRAQLFYPFLHEASFPNPVRSLCVRRSCGIL